MKLGFNLNKTQSILILAGSLIPVVSLAYYYIFRGPRAQTIILEVLPETTLLDLLNLIRKKYSKSYKKFQFQCKKQRRRLRRGSAEYYEQIKDCFKIHNKLLEDAVDEALKERSIKKATYENSMRLLKHEPSISEACQDMRKIINKGPIPGDLNADKLHEILTFYRSRLDSEPPAQNPYSLPLTLTMIEDDIYEVFGTEIEEIERAFDMYWEMLREFEPLIQTISQAKLIDEVEELEAPLERDN